MPRGTQQRIERASAPRFGGRFFLLCFGHGPLNATVDELVAEGFTHIQCYCPRCRTTRLRPISWLPRISLGLTIARFQRGYAARSAVVHCTRSSRGGWKTFLGSRWGVEGRHFPPSQLAFSVS